MDKVDVRKVIEAAGGQSKVASSLGIERQSVWRWVEKNRIPAERCRELEQLTDGAVTAEQMRPDIFKPVQKSA